MRHVLRAHCKGDRRHSLYQRARFCGKALNEVVSQGDVVALPGAGDQPDRIAERIAGCVDFCAEAAARPAKTLGVRSPLFLRAPAAC